MSAVPGDASRLARLRERDLDAVLEIELAIYTHPWTRGNFVDALQAGYECRGWWQGESLIGYFVLIAAAGEAHLLNLSVASRWQRRGYGSALLEEIFALGRSLGASALFLEVRPSNTGARDLYLRRGFSQVGVRRDYYPAHRGREDALVLSRTL